MIHVITWMPAAPAALRRNAEQQSCADSSSSLALESSSQQPEEEAAAGSPQRGCPMMVGRRPTGPSPHAPSSGHALDSPGSAELVAPYASSVDGHESPSAEEQDFVEQQQLKPTRSQLQHKALTRVNSSSASILQPALKTEEYGGASSKKPSAGSRVNFGEEAGKDDGKRSVMSSRTTGARTLGRLRRSLSEAQDTLLPALKGLATGSKLLTIVIVALMVTLAVFCQR
jgi:hypothetical protein